MEAKATTSPRKSILVSGDVMADNHVYQGDRVQPGQGEGIGTYLHQTAGGARLLFDLLDAVRTYKAPKPPASGKTVTTKRNKVKKVSPPGFDVDLGIETDDLTSWPRSLHSFGVWSPFPRTSDPGEKQKTWRMSSPLGYGEAITKRHYAPARANILKKRAGILVLDDGGLTFRHDPEKAPWPTMILKGAKTSPEWIVLKTSHPIIQGDLWRAVSDDRLNDKLVVVTSIADVRREPVRISEGVSWERTVLDLVNELNGNPSLEPLKQCKHCVISFGCAGALHMERTEREVKDSKDGDDPKVRMETAWVFRLLFDPAHLEGDWEATIEGDAIGYISCLAAGIVNGLIVPDPPDPPKPKEPKPYTQAQRLAMGIIAGLEAERVLLMEGHGLVVGDKLPELPVNTVAHAIVTSISRQTDSEEREPESQRFYSASIPSPAAGDSSQWLRWTILAGAPKVDHTAPDSVRPLVGIARRVALFGIRELSRIPVQRTGDLLTVDRSEIEGIRIVQRAIQAYENHDEGKKPLSIALFGAPGSGKSFTVKQIAKSALGEKVPILEFNLSQFSGTTDLIGALHLVRDGALGPNTPVVFWDEFDSQNYKWLQFLLAPMQDGAFQDGQLTHPIGKCVFIFAGGTSCDFEHFGPWSRDAEAVREFKLLKGPDFKSRIHNSLSVVGPNRAPVYDDALDARKDDPLDPWKDDQADICYPIRRALLIRSILGLGKNDELKIDEGMLTALLQINKYTHGVRSLENVLTAISRSNDGGPLRRSDLPHTEVLAMHVDSDEFVDLLNRDAAFMLLANELAPYVHEFYTRNIKRSGMDAVYLEAFKGLPEEIKDSNRAAARRIPEILGRVGLFVVKRPESDRRKKAKLEPNVEKLIRDNIDELAEAEHNGWMATLLSNGWQHGEVRNDADKIHCDLIPFSKLKPATQNKDKDAVHAYKEILAKVNYTITNIEPSSTS